jgi:CRISPR-associated endonuclease/helicase Cas3
VFDEVHQYDDRLFGALLRFIEAFPGAPFLVMTASLPAARLAALQEVVVRATGVELDVVQGPPELEGVKRYELRLPQHDPPWLDVENTLSCGGKVLWVTNKVSRCVDLARKARRRGLDPVLPYHSRYRYRDRVRRHNDVIAAFKQDGPASAVTTQVCEVSLDLSADILVSDLAPVPALIQRLGRLNRRVDPDDPGPPRPAVFLEPENPRPYEAEDLDLARRWLTDLCSGAASQADLAMTFEKLCEGEAVRRVESAWLDSGPFTPPPAPLREPGATIPVLRAEDAGQCIDNRGRPLARKVVEYSIPMLLGPVVREIGGWRRLGVAFVAPEGRIDYSEKWGATWAEK